LSFANAKLNRSRSIPTPARTLEKKDVNKAGEDVNKAKLLENGLACSLFSAIATHEAQMINGMVNSTQRKTKGERLGLF